MLKYFFRHYDGLVDRYVFFDDGSTDQTLAILRKHPKVEIRPFPRLDENDSYVLAAQRVHNECWKESRGLADWVIFTAVDELLYTARLKSYLQTCTRKGVTAIPALGFQMISPTLPSENKPLTNLVTKGCPLVMMNKLSIFDPNKIDETNHIPGRHASEPVGNVKYPEKDVVLLLHYKYIDFEYTFNRYNELNQKLGLMDKKRGFGYEYAWTRERLKQEWDTFEQNAVTNVFARGYNANLQHSPRNERWWRQNEIIIPPPENDVSRLINRLRPLPYQLWMKVPEAMRIQTARLPFMRTLLDTLRYIFLEKGKN